MTFNGNRIRLDLASWGWRLVAVILFVTLPLAVLLLRRELNEGWWDLTKTFAFECVELFVTGDQEL